MHWYHYPRIVSKFVFLNSMCFAPKLTTILPNHDCGSLFLGTMLRQSQENPLCFNYVKFDVFFGKYVVNNCQFELFSYILWNQNIDQFAAPAGCQFCFIWILVPRCTMEVSEAAVNNWALQFIQFLASEITKK